MVRGLEPTITWAQGRAVGWREWTSLPKLGVKAIKVKVDTGARSSCLHAYDVEEFRRQGRVWLAFKVHPLQRSDRRVVSCESPLLEYRYVTSSNGRRELRPVIRTDVELGGLAWEIELTLTRRDAMGFRMLLGRQAVRGRFMVDPGRSYLATRQQPRGKGAP